MNAWPTEIVGRTITSVRRIRYVFEGKTEPEGGPIELSFSGDLVVVLDAGSDGETLVVRQGQWLDPFEEPLDKVNADYVASHGKWTAFDLSKEGRYQELIGQSVDAIVPIKLPSGTQNGIVIWIRGGVLLRIEVSADELYVEMT